MQNFKIEQDIRSSVDEQLKNLGWIFEGKDRNVFQEQPRENIQKKKLKGKRPDYVLYDSKERYRNPLMIIETKKPGANLQSALEQGNWYAEQLNTPLVFATDGVYYKTLHSKIQKPLYLNGEEVNELIRELEAIQFLDKNEVETISKEVKYDRQQLIGIFEEANNLLREEGFSAGMDRFSEFSNILFLKLLGEIEDLKEKTGEDFLVNKDFRWSCWKNKKGDELLRFVNDTVLKEMEKIYQDADIFTPLGIKNPVILKRIIDKLEPLNLINIDSDIKGDAFEYFLQKSTATKNDLGEYFTPRHIVKTMVKLINPQIGEKIYDPFCGTGGMLIESFKHISHNMARTKDNWDQLRKKSVFGNEITNTARITKMNMILIGDGHSGIQRKNSLKNPVEDQYDAVITNMPYSQKTEHGSYYDLPSNKGDSICVQHCIKAIDKESGNGRMAIIVPEGFLFRKDMQKTREYLLDRCYLKSVISLPQGVFLPYTGVKTNILYCTDVKKKKKQEKFWYFDVKNDGYSLDNYRRKKEGETDLQKFLAYRNVDVQDRKDILSVGFKEILFDDVKRNDFILSGNRYLFDLSKNIKWKLKELQNLTTLFVDGDWIESKDQSDSGIRLIQTGNIGEGEYLDKIDRARYISSETFKRLRCTKVVKNDVLVSRLPEPVGRACLIPDLQIKMITAVDCTIIRFDKTKILPQFFVALTMSNDYQKQIKKYLTGSSRERVSRKNLGKIKIPLVPISEQKKIIEKVAKYKKKRFEYKQKVEQNKNNIFDTANSIWRK